ncbi:protein ENHANCED DISEASE RESISTANCE 4-like isoform X2 [Punica granatum]|uniref:Protein ENHANCED DISEASE RESISTANCE 4-like isoform X2 n=1 Tax=Punica granatum TaxID=22663 RepID=A0A6P8BUE7_PUNGR|nr:protein ENHANCED DISEASE RESISTANCE 4-like isoform X2 [Punica granatum]
MEEKNFQREKFLCLCFLSSKAKHYKNDARNAGSDLHKATDAPKDELDKALEENTELGDLDIVIPSSTEHSLDLGNEMEQGISSNCNGDQDSGTDGESRDCDVDRRESSDELDSSHERVEKANQDEQKIEVTSPAIRAESGEETNDDGFNEEQEESQMSVPHKRMVSQETFASTEYGDPCSEFSGTVVGDSCRSPTTIRGWHHAYDGSVSSLDAPADHFHGWDRSSGKQHSRKDEENFGLLRERLRKNKYVSNEMFESSRSRFHDRDGMAYGRSNELPPRVPVYKREPSFLYEDEGTSYQTGNIYFPHSSSYHSSRSPEELAEDEKIRLLRIVYELEDQLKKSCNLDQLDGRKSRAAYYSHELPEAEGLPGLNFPRRNPWAQNFRSARVPFSAETARTTHHLGYSHLGHLPRARQLSEPLLPPPFRNMSIHGPGRRNLYSPYSSWPSSPQPYMGSEFSVGSNDPSYEFQKLRKYYREREENLLKRHLRPIGKAAPFVTCYHCSKILQLPEDSLIFRKRYHRVRCGACSMVLKFSLENGNCVLPYELEAHGPPPSEAEDYDNSVDMAKLYSACDVGAQDMGSSPLHRLMGYSSVSQVFKGPGPSANGTTSPTRKSP